MEVWITAFALALGLGTVGLMAWLERRPRERLEPRLLPTTPVMFLGALVAFLALIHLINLAGYHTGRP